MNKFLSIIAVSLMVSSQAAAAEIDQPWPRHVIDDSSRGADGTRLADVNGDMRLDIVTGWEEGGVTRIYLHPGNDQVKQRWPAVTVGNARSVEDAVLVDLDGDGAMDVVSCCEGSRQVMLVHWAPADGFLDANKWVTQEIPGSENKFRWMYCCPVDVDMDGQIDLVAGGKGNGSELGWWKLPENPRDLAAWQWKPLRRDLGWVMSIEAVDMDRDRDLDLLFTDRKGNHTGCFWMEHPGRDRVTQPWKEHLVGVKEREAMFLSRSDVDRDGFEDLVVSVRPQSIVVLLRQDAGGMNWDPVEIAIPETFGSAKDAAAGDLDGDGELEIAFTTERAVDGKIGVGRIVSPLSDDPQVTPISGVDGIKHDLIQLIDMDGDGDLDVLTCEEAKNLGVIWYENPR